MAMTHFDLVRDVLDKQLVDREKVQMGRVDGIVLELREGQPPRVAHFELGFAVLGLRLHKRVEVLVQKLRRWTVRPSTRQHVPWSSVKDVTQHHVVLDVEAEKTPAFDWERWLRSNVVYRLPGGKPDE